MSKMSTEEEILHIESNMKTRDKAFVAHYMGSFNGTEACRAAGFANRAMEAKASSLLKRRDISRLVTLKLRLIEETARLDTGSTIGLIRDAMHLDPLDYMDDRGQPLPLKDLPTKVRKAIQTLTVREIKNTAGNVVVEYKYQFIGKTRMIELLATIQKLKKDEETDVGDDFVSRLAKAAQRIEKDVAKQKIHDFRQTG